MILQYFKKKENEYKKIADKYYVSTISSSKELIQSSFFKEVSFDVSFEIITVILVFYFKTLKDKKKLKFKIINDYLIQNFISDLDRSMREIGIGDMSIGKYVKKYVKKFYYRIKLIDPILNDFDYKDLAKYLNSIKSTDKKYTNNIIAELKDIFQQIEKNVDII